MNIHKNARLTPCGRVLMMERIESGWSVRRAAQASGVSERTAYRWLMTDNGSAYRSKLFAQTLQRAGIRHVRTRPYTPRTNGKAERFIQTSLREWAYARPYLSSAHRNQAIGPWTDAYNLTRPHSALGGISPLQRLNNLLGNDT